MLNLFRRSSSSLERTVSQEDGSSCSELNKRTFRNLDEFLSKIVQNTFYPLSPSQGEKGRIVKWREKKFDPEMGQEYGKGKVYGAVSWIHEKHLTE